MLRKLKYNLENIYYRMRYGKDINLNDFIIKENTFSGRKLNILLLRYYAGTFGENNTLMPLQELGNVYQFIMTKKAHDKNWYNIKEQKNQEMLKYIESIVSRHNIDVIDCHLSGHSTTPKVLEKIRSYGIPMINESLDDERKFISRKGKDGIRRGMKDICKYFDISLTSSKSAIVKYLVEGGTPIYKDYGANENIYKKLDLEKEYDVGFVGAHYGIRSEYIDYLKKNGINVYSKGPNSGNGFADPDEMIEIFCKSKIVLGFSTVGQSDDIYILKGRDFEVPLTGSFYMTGYHEELKEYFELGKDIETYNSKEDLLKKVIYYLSHEQERETIAKNGYQKCVQNYTAKKSYEKVFGYLGL